MQLSGGIAPHHMNWISNLSEAGGSTMARITVADVQRMKAERRKIVVLTAYYYEMARALDRAAPDMILVGDSGGRFLLGHPDNNDVTLDEMVLMTRSVCRGVEHALVIGDLPFMSYQVSVEEAIRNAGRLVKETRCNAVKLEGGAEFAPTVRALVQVGISVMAHTGLTPMTSAAVGGYTGGAVLPEEQVRRDALALQDAGAFSIILTGVSPDLAARLSQELRIPVISGHGAGDDCDGQIGVAPSSLGWTAEQIDRPRTPYGPVSRAIYEAAAAYVADVRAGKPVRSARERAGAD
jgi:3-methyl-2-oxobutanoate hydroxymethyltransferase